MDDYLKLYDTNITFSTMTFGPFFRIRSTKITDLNFADVALSFSTLANVKLEHFWKTPPPPYLQIKVF